jgi:hypothetical protein
MWWPDDDPKHPHRVPDSGNPVPGCANPLPCRNTRVRWHDDDPGHADRVPGVGNPVPKRADSLPCRNTRMHWPDNDSGQPDRMQPDTTDGLPANHYPVPGFPDRVPGSHRTMPLTNRLPPAVGT